MAQDHHHAKIALGYAEGFRTGREERPRPHEPHPLVGLGHVVELSVLAGNAVEPAREVSVRTVRCSDSCRAGDHGAKASGGNRGRQTQEVAAVALKSRVVVHFGLLQMSRVRGLDGYCCAVGKRPGRAHRRTPSFVPRRR